MKNIDLKKFSLIVLAILMFSNSELLAQPLNGTVEKPYDMWIIKTERAPTLKGYLLTLEDSLIVVRHELLETIFDVQVSGIKQLKFRRQKKVGRGLGYGAMAGASAGAIVGLVSGGNSTTGGSSGFISCFWQCDGSRTRRGISVPGGIFLGALSGGIVGTFIGSFKEKVIIGGNQNNYLQVKDGLLNYTLKF